MIVIRPLLKAIALNPAVAAGLCLLLVLGFVSDPSAAERPKKHVVSHDKVLVVTDPSKGTNSYPKWAVFPSSDVEYRKVILWITYACPDSLHCGEWDYIDQIKLRRAGGEGAPDRSVELARMISPYGWQFGSDWHFTWHVDITDFSILLHDSIEIEFVHTGYESNTDRGWKITLDFEITEGRPAMRCLGMDTLWCGSFPYGDPAKPIERLLRPVVFEGPVGAEFARVRIHQTGHGMDDSANCAEFCRKNRQLKFDGSLFAQRYLWRECGDNPLYHQSGTWIFDRSNWCPGAVVYPDQYDLPIKSGSSHQVEIAMEPYVNPNKPTANWQIYSYLFYYERPWAKNDVSIEEIITPSQLDEYSRMNPVCGQARIVVKNNGSEMLESFEVSYGPPSLVPERFTWTGALKSQQTVEVVLPGPTYGDINAETFPIIVSKPNGLPDEYNSDNGPNFFLGARARMPESYPAQLVLALRTNHDSSQTSYRLCDVDGNVIRERKQGTFAGNTLYSDTLACPSGCYRLQVEDTAGDGLDFWFNAEGGYGYVRLLDMDGRLIKSFTSDFGKSIDHWFIVGSGATSYAPDSALPIVQPFPPRNQGKCDVDIFFNEPTTAIMSVVTEDSSRVVFTQHLVDFKEGFVPVDISTEPDGIYWLRVEADGKSVTRRLRIKH